MNVRPVFSQCLWRFVFCCALLCAGAQAAPNVPPDQYFAGAITALEDGKITVRRTVLGKDSTRSFQITSQTRIEGRPKVNARVTVKYVATEDGDMAIHIIVRAPIAKK
jgi:hypothetical protein